MEVLNALKSSVASYLTNRGDTQFAAQMKAREDRIKAHHERTAIYRLGEAALMSGPQATRPKAKTVWKYLHHRADGIRAGVVREPTKQIWAEFSKDDTGFTLHYPKFDLSFVP